MNRLITISLAMFVGAGLGAAAVQSLHAQAKPPAFNIAEITVTNDEGYNKEYVPPIVKSIQDLGASLSCEAEKRYP